MANSCRYFLNLTSGILEEDGILWFTMRKSLVSFDGSDWTSTAIPDADWNTSGLASMGNGSFFITLGNGDPVRRFDGTNWEVFSTKNSSQSIVNTISVHYLTVAFK